MKSTLSLFQVLVTLAMASPHEPRQAIDTSLVDSAPSVTSVSIPIGPTADSTTYNLSEATESATESPLPVGTEPATQLELVARQTACQTNPAGAGPTPNRDTDSAFLGLRAFARIATQAPTPSGYNVTFVNIHARSVSYGYLGFITVDSYDTQTCADQCDDVWRGCQGFNIFFERDPSLAPGTGCTNPPSTTNIKCIFWGGLVSVETAINTGQYVADFHVVIAGSNGYMKNAVPTVPGYDGEPTGNDTIDVPPDDMDPTPTTTTTTTASTSTTSSPTNTAQGGTYIGSRIFTNTFFDPGLCAAACDAQNRNNLANPPETGQPQICRFFTTYLLLRNGRPAGQYCALYTRYYSRRFATNGGARIGGDTLSVRHAFSYRNRRAL
ncbi:hypothetical protein F4813DRAFT_355707 [Daldinia decipiens]|uniref:uncharacterized protein n=1 Tax=Daldinia decipiens TaxID=326647 RepID=UPI0020C28913|nr:uncharacterized protein F4813DRAFT_355707 [Daldinia decipiens]KAI1658607.1 hypothetical protein F4813DRAFT_355707 [Daldinia decipiens]